MNRTEFIQLIHDPSLPATRHVAALKQVVADFPYFTVSQVLLAKALHNEKHYEYEKYLKQTALAVPDREVLYYYLHNIEAPTLAEPARTEPLQTISAPVIPAATLPEPPVAPVTEIKSPEPVANEPEVIPAEPVNIVPKETPEPVLTEETPVIEEEPTVSPMPEEMVIADQPEPTPEPEAAKPVTPPEPTGEEAHSFMEWLMLKSGQEVAADEPEETPEIQEQPDPQEQPADQPAEEPATDPQQPLPEVTRADIEKAVAKSNVNDFGSILDKFIKENPSISRPKAEFFNPVNMARQSVEEDDELVTETLANLLYKQGHLKKAIRAYEKLCLLYPSKMTYFASLIQKIKTELKD